MYGVLVLRHGFIMYRVMLGPSFFFCGVILHDFVWSYFLWVLLVHSQGTHWLVLSLSTRYIYFFFRASTCGSLPKVLLRGSRANDFSSIYATTFVCSFPRSFLPTPSCGGVIGGAASAFRHLVSMTFKDLINPSSQVK
jgi:hypothetical protein